VAFPERIEGERFPDLGVEMDFYPRLFDHGDLFGENGSGNPVFGNPISEDTAGHRLRFINIYIITQEGQVVTAGETGRAGSGAAKTSEGARFIHPWKPIERQLILQALDKTKSHRLVYSDVIDQHCLWKFGRLVRIARPEAADGQIQQ
jgi:hypothetical protein